MPGSDSLINPRAFDGYLNAIAAEDADFIVDNGADCYFPLLEYMRETDAVTALLEAGKEIFLHSVITGSQAFMDTLRGFDSLARFAPPEARLVVWLNEYYGPIEAEGKDFEHMQVYERHRERIHALGSGPLRRRSSPSCSWSRESWATMDRKWIIGEVAKRHGILLDKDDPVLVTLTFHELLVNEYVERVTDAVEQAHAQTLTASARQVEYAKKSAGGIPRRCGPGFAGNEDDPRGAVRVVAHDVVQAEEPETRA